MHLEKNQNILVGRYVTLLAITSKEVSLNGGVHKYVYIYNVPLYYV